jgi:hypothetical protein
MRTEISDEDAVEVDIEDQIREIINGNDSIWIIAIKCFKLGRSY